VRLAYTPDTSDLHWKDFFRSFGRFGEAMKWGFRAWKKGPAIVLALVIAGGLAYLKKYVWIASLAAYPLALGVANYFIFMGLSLFESLTETLHGWTEWIVEKIRDAYTRGLSKMLGKSALILVGTAVFLGVTGFLVAPQIHFNFLPNSDAGTMSVFVRFPAGTSQAYANQVAALVESFLRTRSEVDTVQSIVGNNVEEDLTLIPIEKRPNVSALSQTYRGILVGILKDFPNSRISVGTGGYGGGGFGGSSIQLSMVSFNEDLLYQRNAAIVSAVQNNPYVADVVSSLSDTTLENDFVPNPNMLNGTGIATQTIANVLQTYASGMQASNVVTGGLSYPIMVEVDPTSLSSGQSLLDMPVYSPTLQTNLQIGQLGSFVLNQKPTSIARYNRQYTGLLTINLKPNAPSVLEMQNGIVADLTAKGLLKDGLSITTNSSFGSVALAAQLLKTGPLMFLLAFFLAYLVMAAQFNSWRYPIYLLLPVPLAIIGAILVVWLVGGGLDIFGVMGMLMLIGLSAKNAILYLDFVVERIGKMPLQEALIEAASLRFRPIVMTTLTVLVISFPLVFSTGQGAEFGQRMGIVMFGGIVFSAILTFFVVPAAFFAFEKNHKSATFNTSKAEIDAACEDIEEGHGPEECAPEPVSAPIGLADAPAKPKRKRKNLEQPDVDEEYGV